MFFGNWDMRLNYRKIGEYIRLVDERNAGLKVTNLLGLSISKRFIPSVANTVGTDMGNYKIIRRNQFAASVMQVRRDRKMPVALLTEADEAIISQAYPVFEVIDTNKVLPEYLMMWFSRPEFDREACFYAVGGVRGSLEWEDFCDMKFPIPSIDKQRKIVAEYNAIQDRIKLNEQIIQKLEETAQAIYKQWFVDFEFPNEEGKPYKSSGGEMVDSELGEIPKGWHVGNLSKVSNCLDFRRRPLSELERRDFQGDFPYYGAMGIVDYVREYIFDGEYVLFSEDGVNVIDKDGRPSVSLVWGRFWVNNHAHILEGKNGFSTRYLYLVAKNSNVRHLVTGAAQPKINQENMNSIEVTIPSINIVTKFQEIITPFFDIVKVYRDQNVHLGRIAEILLSRMATSNP